MKGARTVALSLALLGAGCGGGAPAGHTTYPVPGCESIDPSACDVRKPDCETRLFAMAACLRGDAPGALPPVTVVSTADFGAMLAAEAAAETPDPHRSSWDWALSTLRLIAKGDLTPEAQIAQAVDRIWGVYRDDTKDILVIDHGADFDEQAASTVLVHELVHALQDREIDLAQLKAPFSALGSDAKLAIRAMIEGEARMQETRYQASVIGLRPSEIDWTRRFENAVTRDETQLFMKPAPYTQTSGTFPYEWGARYVYFWWTAHGMSGVHALFLAPPVSTRVLMASETAAVAPEALPVSPVLPAAPTASWTMGGHDVLGAWGLFLALQESAPTTPTADLQSLALQWRADQLGIYEPPTSPVASPTALVWWIDLADQATAARVAQLLAASLGTGAVRAQGSSVVVAKSSDDKPLDWAFVPGPTPTSMP